MAEEDGYVKPEDKDVIDSVFNSKQKAVTEIMQPLKNVVPIRSVLLCGNASGCLIPTGIAVFRLLPVQAIRLPVLCISRMQYAKWSQTLKMVIACYLCNAPSIPGTGRREHSAGVFTAQT